MTQDRRTDTTPDFLKRHWYVAVLGAREHYSIAHGFEVAGRLKYLFTDAWCRVGSGFLKRAPGPFRGLATRFHPGIPSSKVVSFTPYTLLRELRQRKVTDNARAYMNYIEQGKWFAQRVNRCLARQTNHAPNDGYIGFSSGALETLQFTRSKGIFSIIDQIDPGRVEEEMVFQESLKWPGWQIATGRIPDAFYERLSAEWDEADCVLVNSKWSLEALVKQDVPRSKLIVVPLAYEPIARKVTHTKPPSGVELRVLWLGTVNLRKGIAYLIEAAKRLKDTNIRITVAGQLGISEAAVASAPSNMTFIGRVTRDQAASVYERADVFVLPTISDGFAITQLEAMSHGLPVITTPNCGEVVTHGVDGLIVPAMDAEALAGAIVRLDDDRALLNQMSAAALVKCRQFSIQNQIDSIDSQSAVLSDIRV